MPSDPVAAPPGETSAETNAAPVIATVTTVTNTVFITNTVVKVATNFVTSILTVTNTINLTNVATRWLTNELTITNVVHKTVTLTNAAIAVAPPDDRLEQTRAQALRGDAPAQFQLGLACLRGAGVPPDAVEMEKGFAALPHKAMLRRNSHSAASTPKVWAWRRTRSCGRPTS